LRLVFSVIYSQLDKTGNSQLKTSNSHLEVRHPESSVTRQNQSAFNVESNSCFLKKGYSSYPNYSTKVVPSNFPLKQNAAATGTTRIPNMKNVPFSKLYPAWTAVLYLLLVAPDGYGQSTFRILPYLQVFDQGNVQLTWFGNSPLPSNVRMTNSQGTELMSRSVSAEEVPELYYTRPEREQTIPGLENGSWLEGNHAYRYQVTIHDLPPGETVQYTVRLGSEDFRSEFRTHPHKDSWKNIRFVALSDSETEPAGRVTHRTWYPGVPSTRPFAVPQLWRDKFGSTREQGIELPNYFLSEQDGYAANLKIINSRNPDFMLMPGDLVQGGGYQPGWDEFFRHNAGSFDKGLTRYPIVPALGNWESFGGINGGYGFNEKSEFAPKVGRSRFHAYFGTPVSDPLQKRRQSYYRVDYGPVTILTLDSGNGTPDQSRSDFPEGEKIKGKQYTLPGTDTQENFTKAQYEGSGGQDLSGFAPGTDQYVWLEHHLKQASEQKQLIFVQYHHSPFSSGEHGLPMNHELSSGQGGTPLRSLHPLLEKYGVIAVLAGHDELFERSFVDIDGDGKGIHYYDVGVAGDGMRGEKRDGANLLNYNPYKKWTADQNSQEVWNTTGSRPLLEDGGKHYGHLEVNLEKIRENGNEYAKIRFSPVYIFPVLNADYQLQRVERRVYPDEVELKIPLESSKNAPILKASITLNLNASGAATVNPADLFTSLGSYQIDEITVSKDQFTCGDVGTNSLKVTAQKAQGTDRWTEELQVLIRDNTPPTLAVKTLHVELDAGVASLPLKADDFTSSVADNCEVAELSIDRTTVSAEEAGAPIAIVVTAVDKSGNRVSVPTELIVSVKPLVLGNSPSGADSFKIYPNPSSGRTEVNIETVNATPPGALKIYDLTGRERSADVGVTSYGSTGLTLDISVLNPGTYLFYLEDSRKKSFLGRVIKQ
jgi:hypothetical protein